MRNRYTAYLLALLLLWSAPVFAQGWTTDLSGNVTLSGVAVLLPRGSDSRPTLASQTDTNTGIRFPSTNQISFILAGNQKALFDANGFLFNTAYFNFGSTSGSSGYGIRDNGGTIEFKNSGQSWGTIITTGGNLTFSGNNTFTGTNTFSISPVFSTGTATSVVGLDSSKALTTSFASAALATSLSDETGSGAVVFGTSPTLTTPHFSSIVNTGTLTLPTSTDTLVGRATTDTFTNKTLTVPTINGATLSGTVAGTPTFSGVLTLSSQPVLNAGVDISGASSGQVKFPTTQNASSDAHTLDDYAEVTWTPTDASGAGLTFSAKHGFYVKIGRLIWATFDATWPSTADGTTLQVGGLPFASAATYTSVGACKSSTLSVALEAVVGASSSTITFTNSSGSTINNGNMSTKTMVCTVSYLAAN